VSSEPTSKALGALFPAKARRALVEFVFSDATREASMSELARRAGLTPRAVAVEVARLEEAGLVEIRAVGPAHVVRPSARSSVARALYGLVKAATATSSRRSTDRDVRRSLVAYGAPLVGEELRQVYSLSETILRGLRAARTDATVLRVLPVVVAKHAARLDWTDLKERARRMNLRAELGMLLDLTAAVASLPELRTHAAELTDGRRKRLRYFPRVEGAFEEQLAARRSPEAATRWHFVMNMTEDSFREMVRKHVSAP